ncbi:MAG: hypothetical protein COV91_04810 [Candidatus Taylorbacteria bacterium CG11_big_fil_rev_8_21_14_0_20_46_11]|uniref:Small ribosomal subunit protein bS6 n=1 Tax=Candidatus Taylorbacteria bacterium CG11_big_fil_rev_8_21_14_0_20_46_11 TaxID=1975025 RepID=A0A2H0KD57_9BACT|nr:MAG: hypothetical protein COV91_04810 [Candidatus Taylorbacteria bacterium CG11_big_fil_rev_8_21_14_0_20_46_11]
MSDDTQEEGKTLSTVSDVSEEVVGDEGAENRIYEVGYLLVGSLAENDVPREVTVIKDILEKEGAVVFAEEFPKMRPLTYKMKKSISGAYQTFENAYFGWMKFEVTGDKVKVIEEELKRDVAILRYLLIKTVREHTLVGARPPRTDGPREKREAPTEAPPSAPVSEVELEKSIEKLIAE